MINYYGEKTMELRDLLKREDLTDSLREWLESNHLDKMKKGEWFSPGFEEVCEARINKVVHRFNKALPETAEYDFLANEIVKNDGGLILIQPFYAEFGFVKAGKNVFIGNNCSFIDGGSITLGDDVMIAPRVVIATATHPLDPKLRKTKIVKCSPVVIEDNVWIGSNVTIFGGVTIGENSVVGAGSVVTRDIPKNCIAMGSPCRVVKERNQDKGLKDLTNLIDELEK